LHGHMMRSRARWIEEGETPLRYFCSLESRNYLNNTIKKRQNTKHRSMRKNNSLNSLQNFKTDFIITCIWVTTRYNFTLF
jgi:hypothetical protein